MAAASATSVMLALRPFSEAAKRLWGPASEASGNRERLDVAGTRRKVTDPAGRARVNAMLAKGAARRDVASVASPSGSAGAAQLSSSGRIAFANVALTKQ